MFAIAKVASKQYKVSAGDVIDIPRVSNKKSISFEKVLMTISGEDINIGTPYIKDAKVVCDVIGDVKGEKKIAYKFKHRSCYHLKKGHRDLLTRVKVKEIVGGQ